MNLRSIPLFALALLTHGSVVAQADAGLDQYICGNSTTLQANIPGVGESGFWGAGSSGAVFVDATDPLTQVSNLPYGMTEIIWGHIAPTGASSDVVSIWAYDAAMAFADAGPDQLILAPPNFAYLSGSTPIAPAVCSWTVVSGTCTITDPTDPNTIVTDLGIGWNVLNWNCDNGPCGSSTDQVTIQMMLSTGVEDASNGQQNFFAYNTGSGELNVLNGTTVNAFDVFESRGRCISSTKAGTRSISMTDRPEGIYVARAIVDDRSVVYRFVVTH